MRYYIIAGEASGDLHASNLMKALKQLDATSDFRCWGGDLMQAQGGTIVKHYKDLAFMGFWEVATHLRTILSNLSFCKRDIMQYQPDVLVLVDYPGFNLRIATWAKAQGFKVVYYISPQIWAWKTGRVHKIKRCVDRMMTILPFEKPFYERYGYAADYVGHPLLDVYGAETRQQAVAEQFRRYHQLSDKPIIALLPGSRRQELLKILPTMLEVVEEFPAYQFVISQVPWLPDSLYQSMVAGKRVKLVQAPIADIVLNAEAALVTSGTATLETAILQIPQVVCYKTSAISYQIAKRVAKGAVKYISLVNLILDKPAVKELIQEDMNRASIVAELKAITENQTIKDQMAADYRCLLQLLGSSGASLRAAKIVVDVAKTSKLNR